MGKIFDRQDSWLTHGFSEQYKTLKNSENCRFHKRSWDWHAWLSLREEVYKCDLKFCIAHDKVTCELVLDLLDKYEYVSKQLYNNISFFLNIILCYYVLRLCNIELG